ncbi:hypothetical protein HDC37_000340 [Microbacterium sp. AK009]|uniref:glycosyltransferase n=1 Tax=Microbacterium sp. AK009 TaxID=2723068 RepID=UPI0015C800F3|nr:glycosyltransferase [Microbacterium sp. AK009]NYF15528.1 hypothetical protein [Microbacterium sp. AK009]
MLFISWAEDNGRTRDLAKTLGVPPEFVAVDRNLSAARRYLHQSLKTWRVLQSTRPSAVLLMLPPTPLLMVTRAWSLFHRTRLVADLHTGFFYDPKWTRFRRLGLWLLRGSTGIVTNAHLADILTAAQVSSVVAHDPLEDRIPATVVKPDELYVLCPVSYANDEPIEAILEAAKMTPEVTWKLTGKAPASVIQSASANVQFTGYVSNTELVALFRDASVVLALTTRDHTMQRAGYEALMFGVPQVTSDFECLREFIASAGEFVDPGSADEIASAVEATIAERPARREASRRILHARLDDQAIAIRQILRVVRGAEVISP